MSVKWEKSVQAYFESHKPELEYLDLSSLEKPPLKSIAHNLAYLNYQEKLQSKVLLKHLYVIQEKISELEAENKRLRKDLVSLTKEVVENRPLTERKVQELVVNITSQPKEIEQQAVKLTKDLQLKLDRVEDILRRLEGAVTV